MELDQQLCYCFHISKRKIINFVKRERPKRASQISECFGAGTGCGWCVPFLKQIHRQIVAGEAVEAGSITAGQYESMRSGYLTEIKAGTRKRNRHRGEGCVTSDLPQDGLVTQDDLDYTRYFSTARHDPPPETIEAPAQSEEKAGKSSKDDEGEPSKAADADDVGA